MTTELSGTHLEYLLATSFIQKDERVILNAQVWKC